MEENIWKRVNKTNSTPHIIYKDKLHICMISPVFEEKRALKHFLFRKQFFMILFLFGKCMKRHWHFSPVYVYFIWMLSFIVSHKIYWRSIWLSIFPWKHLYVYLHGYFEGYFENARFCNGYVLSYFWLKVMMLL